jgi:hypothetical protein
MRSLSRFSSAWLVGPLLLGLSGCPEQKAEVKSEPAADTADKSGASEAQKAEGEKTAEPKKEKKEEDEGGW